MRKKILSLLAVAVGAALLVPNAFAQGGILSGEVTDAETGEPIPGATVRLDGHSPLGNAEPDDPRDVLTNDRGQYTMLGLPSGQWNITVQAEGYQAAPGVVTVRFGRNAPVDVEMEEIPHPLIAEVDRDLLGGMNRAERNAFLDGIQAELAEADAARNSSDWETALRGYQSLLERFPTMSGLHFEVGTALSGLQRWEESIEAFETGAEANPARRSEADTQIARQRANMGDSSAVETLIASGDAAREDYYNLGETAFAQGNTADAAGWYEKAAAADPDWILPVFKLGLVALNQGDIEAAKTHFTRAVELDPGSPEGAQAQAVLGQLP